MNDVICIVTSPLHGSRFEFVDFCVYLDVPYIHAKYVDNSHCDAHESGPTCQNLTYAATVGPPD